MNKDVIYIEPEQDITDILSNVKAAKHKIIALVPPKKAGVLRSAVNFKLIAKTARQHEKTVVLITTDESLQRLASTVKMPVAKSLQSKPQIPNLEDIADDDETKDDVIEDDKKPVEEEKVEEAVEEEPAEEPVLKAAPKKAAPVLAKKPAKEEVIEGEPEPEEKENTSKAAKAVAKMKGAKIPNFAKYRKFIIAGMIVLILLIGFTVWATAIAPAVSIVVTVHTSKSNFAEKVSFVNHEDKADPKNGVLYLEEKTVTKTAETQFDATGELDKGTKATGKVTITRPANELVTPSNQTLSVSKGATFTIGGLVFEVTEGASYTVNADTDCKPALSGCLLKNDVSIVAQVAAKEVGDKYNIAATSTGIASSTHYPSNYKIVTKEAMTGGTSKMVKIVSEEDVKAAASGLTAASANEAREELSKQFGDEYILLGEMEQSDPKDTVTPNVDEEVAEGVKPKLVREVTFKMFAVKKDAVKTFITKKLKENASGDKTQTIYDAGENAAFFEKFQNSTDESTARLKTSVITGPKVTEEMVADKSLGKKVGEVKHLLQSINGVSSVSINPNFFWVTSVPSDHNKVQIKITVEQ